MSHFSGDANNSMRSAPQISGQLKVAVDANKSTPKGDLQINDDFLNLLDELDQEVLLDLCSNGDCKDNLTKIYSDLNIEKQELNLDFVFDDGSALIEKMSSSEIRDDIEEFQNILLPHLVVPAKAETRPDGNEFVGIQSDQKNIGEPKRKFLDKLSTILENTPDSKDTVNIPVKSETPYTKNIIKAVNYIIQNSPGSYAAATNKLEGQIQNLHMAMDLQAQSARPSQPAPKPVPQDPVAQIPSPLIKTANQTTDADMTKAVTQDAEIFHRFVDDRSKDERVFMRQTDLAQDKSSGTQIAANSETSLQTGKNYKYQYHTFLPIQQVSQRIISQIQTEIAQQSTINIQRHQQTFQEQPRTSYMDIQLEPEGLGVVKIRMSMASNQLSLLLDFTETDTARYFKHEETTLLSIIKSSDVNIDDVVLRINEANRNALSSNREQQGIINNNSLSHGFSRQNQQDNTQDNVAHEFDQLNMASDNSDKPDELNKTLRKTVSNSAKYI